MLKLDTEIDIRAFWSWWTQELLALLPANIIDGFYHGSGFLVVQPKQDKLEVTFQKNAGTQAENIFLGEFDATNAAKSALKSKLEQQVNLTDAEVVIRIPAALGLQKMLSLPEVATTNLQQVITYELDRYTPFNAEQVYFDCAKLGKPVNGQLSVALMVVQKPVLDDAYEQALALGLKPGYVDCEQLPLNQLPVKERYNLLPLVLRHLKSKKPRVIMYCSMALMVALLFMLFAQPLWFAFQGIDKLKSHLHKVEKLALQVEDSKKGIDYLYQATNKLISKKQNSAPLVEIFDILSKQLKNDTWLSQLRYTKAGLELLGEAANASELIATLEKTGRFRNTRFISPVTQDRSTGKERFQITTEIIPVTPNAPESK